MEEKETKLPINTILYGKGWYEKREPKLMWMDLAHTINKDGWITLTNERSVSNWCLNRFDEFKKSIWKDNNYYCLSRFIEDVRNNMNLISIDLDSSIIYTFVHYLFTLQIPKDKLVKPNENVLPLSENLDYDYLKSVFHYYPDQKFERYEQDIETIEEELHITNWKNIIDIPKYRYLKKYEISGKELNNKTFNLGMYWYCKFDENKNYICRIKKDEYGNRKIVNVKEKGD